MLAEKVTNAGSVFLGKYSCESAGDYASGTNHTLPTNGFARNFSGVSAESFMKKITFQEISAEGLKNLGPVIEKMAEAELLHGHKNAVIHTFKIAWKMTDIDKLVRENVRILFPTPAQGMNSRGRKEFFWMQMRILMAVLTGILILTRGS